MSDTLSFPRKREPMFLNDLLGPRFRGDDLIGNSQSYFAPQAVFQ
jgi:hypothetical protein